MKILATNGKRERLMSPGELQSNPEWSPVKPGAKAVAPAQKNAADGKPKEVVTLPPVSSEPKKVTTPDAVSEPTKKVEAAETSTSPIHERLKEIKATKTVEELDALMKGEDRKTALNMAEKHRAKIEKKS